MWFTQTKSNPFKERERRTVTRRRGRGLGVIGMGLVDVPQQRHHQLADVELLAQPEVQLSVDRRTALLNAREWEKERS